MIVSTNKLLPGMELAADVMNLNNMLLLGQGTILTERHLHVFKMWGIDAVNVVGGENGQVEEKPDQEVIPPRILSEAENRVNHRFMHVTGASGRIGIVKKLAVKHTSQMFLKKKQTPTLE